MTSSFRPMTLLKVFLKQSRKGNAISKRMKTTVKICQGDILRVIALKPSTKGATNSSFRSAPYTKPSKSKTTTEM